MSYWLPVYQLSPPEYESVVSAFCAAFDDCSLWTGNGLEWILLGSRDLQGPVERESMGRLWRQPRVADLLDEIGVESPGQLMALFVADAKTLPRRAPPLEDDHPGRIGPRIWGHGTFGGYFPGVMEARASRRRYQDSAYLRRLLPPDVHAAGLEAYGFQEILNGYFGTHRVPPGARLANLDRALDAPGRRSLSLWLMGTEKEAVAIAERATPSAETASEIEFQLGAAALADGRETEAGDRFERAAEGGDARAARFAVLARARAGDVEAARALGHRHYPEPDAPDKGTRAFLRRRFDLDW